MFYLSENGQKSPFCSSFKNMYKIEFKPVFYELPAMPIWPIHQSYSVMSGSALCNHAYTQIPCTQLL